MLDLRLLSDPKALNQPVSPLLRWLSAALLAIGFGICVALAVDTLRHWRDVPHSALYLGFLTAAGGAAGALAVRLFRGDRIVGPVQTPPRPLLVRLLGLLMVMVFGPLLLVSTSWLERLEFGAFAIGGFAWLLWPRQFFPEPRHGA